MREFEGCLAGLMWIVSLIIAVNVIIFKIAECFLPTGEFDAIDGLHTLFSVIILILILMYFYSRKHRKELETKFDAERRERNNLEDLLKKERSQFENSLKLEQIKFSALFERNKELRNTISSRAPFKFVAELTRDCFSAIFDREEHYLRYKSRPATKSADIVKELKAKYNQMGELYLNIQYKYRFLLNLFPELVKYIEDEESSIYAGEAMSVEKFQEEYDHSRDYLSIEEYKRLSVDERNQLALDRYKERRRKNSWVAGVEYELFYSYKLRQEGYNVINFGAERGVDDLGRDIIATKNGNTYIIQCKRYGIHHEVHENTICQLFGTTLHYKITERQRNLFTDPSKVFPVLVTTGILSDTAKEFANKLGVKVVYLQMGEYPMIKCNINNGEKIYHLPFDQQYWRTKIDKPGEFYATTVKEATAAGFRRAFKHIVN